MTTIRLTGIAPSRRPFMSGAPVGSDVQELVAGRWVAVTLTDTLANSGRFHADLARRNYLRGSGYSAGGGLGGRLQ